MSEQIKELENQLTETQQVSDTELQQTEREYWKEQANLLGLKYPNNVTLDKLKLMVSEKKAENDKAQESSGTKGRIVQEKLAPEIISAYDKAYALVRFKLTVLDPNKQSWTGMLVSAGTANMPSVRRMISFTAPILHAERIIVEHLKEMRYQAFRSAKHPQLRESFNNVEKPKLVPMFHIEELPQLTSEELKALAEAQASQGTGQVDDDQYNQKLYGI